MDEYTMKMDNDTIIKHWKEKLSCFRINNIVKDILSAETVEFLSSIGLPDKHKIRDSNFSTFQFILTDTMVFDLKKVTYVILEDGIPEKKCICAFDNSIRAIYGVPPFSTNENPNVSYMNQDIVSFASFLTIYDQNISQILEISEKLVQEYNDRLEKQYLRSIYNLESQFRMIDPQALLDDTCYWWWKIQEMKLLF